jgi:hypothetical protein
MLKTLKTEKKKISGNTMSRRNHMAWIWRQRKEKSAIILASPFGGVHSLQ